MENKLSIFTTDRFDIQKFKGFNIMENKLNTETSMTEEEVIKDTAQKKWGNVHRSGVLGFIEGAKWQQERSYSEEEFKKLAFDFYYDMSHKMGVSENLISENRINIDQWFEQYKKK